MQKEYKDRKDHRGNKDHRENKEYKDQNGPQGEKGDSPTVENNLKSTSTKNALSAYQGKVLGDRLDKIEPTEWQSLSGNILYKKEGNKMYIRGSVTGLSNNNITITLPYTIPKQHTFLLAGSSLFYTKAWITAGTKVLNIQPGTGNENATYYINHCIQLD